MAKSRTETWIALIVLAAGALFTAILGLFGFMSLTTVPLHSTPQDIPSVTRSAPAPKWAGAVDGARQIVRTAVAGQNLPGLSVAVGIDGNVIWAEGFGWADLERRERVAPETRFRIGTASTVLTSAAVGLLLEERRLNLDDQVQTYVPELPRKQWPVTLRQVMGHVAGLRSDGGDEGPLFSAHCESPVEGVQRIAKRSLLFEPGTQYRYSNYGWIVVSAAVEAAADEPFLSFMEKRVFEPLGMIATTDDPAVDPTGDRATSYFPRFASDPRYGLDLMRPLDYSCYAGSSVFVSTPSDLVRFALGIERGSLLQRATVQLLQTPLRLSSGEETGYALGWDVERTTLTGTPTRWVGHDGMLLGGMAASLITFPDRRLVVSIMSNTSYADTESLALTIAQTFAAFVPVP